MYLVFKKNTEMTISRRKEPALNRFIIKNWPEPEKLVRLIKMPSTNLNPLVLVKRPNASAVVK